MSHTATRRSVNPTSGGGSQLLLIDVHAHLDHVLFKDDLGAVLESAKAAGLKAVITNGTNPASNKAVLALAKKHPIIKVALGLYPIDALGKAPDAGGLPQAAHDINVDEALEYIAQHKDEIVGIGEVGMDYKFDHDLHAVQKENFGKIMALSEQIRRPLIIHSRAAEADVVSLLESSNLKSGVLHCFSGSKKLIRRAADRGFSFSIPPNIVKSHHFQMLVDLVPVSQLLTETDSPWLGPLVGERNVPHNVRYSVEAIARIKGLEVMETSQIIFKNYVHMFGNL